MASNSQKEVQCPYCTAPYNDAGRCDHCGSIFPWTAEIAKIKDEIKEREVNRGRATFTLIDEIVGAAQGKNKISIPAIKGFAFAWLFPRTVIVIGSVVSALILMTQTAIIFRQTDLLRGQTEAAQSEQADRLRTRIAETAKLSLSLTRLQAFFTGMTRGHAQCSGNCREASMNKLLAEFRGHKISSDLTKESIWVSDLSPGALELYSVWIKYQSELSQFSKNTEGSGMTAAQNLLEEAVLKCLASDSVLPQATVLMNRMSPWTTRSHTTDGLESEFTRALQLFAFDWEAGQNRFSKEALSLSLREFSSDMHSISTELSRQFKEVVTACQQRIDTDKAKLKKIETPIL